MIALRLGSKEERLSNLGLKKGLGDFFNYIQSSLPDVTPAVQEDVLGFAVPVDDALLVQVAQSQDNLTGIEPAAFLREAGISAHVVNVELQVPALHYCQN